MSAREGYDEAGNRIWPARESAAVEQESEELVSPDRLLRYLDVSARVLDSGQVDHAGGADSAGESDWTDQEEVLPRILSMPDGITVQERLVGRAVAQWVLQVRCDCGRRWFELDVVDTATCPRCGQLVYVDLDARGKRPDR